MAVRAAILAVLCACVAAQTTVITMTPGQSYPAGFAESQVSRPVRDFTPLDSATLVTNNNSNIVFYGSRLMTARLSQKLDQLSGFVQTYYSGFFRLAVYEGYLPPIPDFSQSYANLSLQYEGRAAKIGLVSTSAQVTQEFVGMLGGLAILAYFDWVSMINATQIYVSVIPTTCETKVDLVFLLDGSGSIGLPNFQIALNFVNQIVSYFQIGPDATRVGIVTFSGDLGWVSPVPSLWGNCPNNTLFEFTNTSGVPRSFGCICQFKQLCTSASGGCRVGQMLNASRQLELVYFFSHSCPDCVCSGPSFPAVFPAFQLNTFNTLAAIQNATANVAYPQGNTLTSLGLQYVRNTMFTAENGARPVSAGIPRVLIVLTDGLASPGYDPTAEARIMQEDGVKIFSIGVGNFSSDQLIAMASQPISQHVYALSTFTQLYDIVGRMSALSCDSSAPLRPGWFVERALDDSIVFFSLECFAFTTNFTLTLISQVGTAAAYVSSSVSAPSALRFDYRTTTNASVQVLTFPATNVSRTSVAVETYTVGSRFRIYASNNLVALDRQTFSVSEATLPPSVAVPGNHFRALVTTPLRFELYTLQGSPMTTPFAINSTTGAIFVTGSLDFEVTPHYALLVVTRSALINCMADIKPINVTIENVNEAPVFSQANYSAVLSSYVAVNSTLLRVLALDPERLTVTYSWVSTTSGPALFFDLDPATGSISVRTFVGLPISATLSGIVIASDGVTLSTATVVIVINLPTSTTTTATTTTTTRTISASNATPGSTGGPGSSTPTASAVSTTSGGVSSTLTPPVSLATGSVPTTHTGLTTAATGSTPSNNASTTTNTASTTAVSPSGFTTTGSGSTASTASTTVHTGPTTTNTASTNLASTLATTGPSTTGTVSTASPESTGPALTGSTTTGSSTGTIPTAATTRLATGSTTVTTQTGTTPAATGSATTGTGSTSTGPAPTGPSTAGTGSARSTTITTTTISTDTASTHTGSTSAATGFSTTGPAATTNTVTGTLLPSSQSRDSTASTGPSLATGTTAAPTTGTGPAGTTDSSPFVATTTSSGTRTGPTAASTATGPAITGSIAVTSPLAPTSAAAGSSTSVATTGTLGQSTTTVSSNRSSDTTATTGAPVASTATRGSTSSASDATSASTGSTLTGSPSQSTVSTAHTGTLTTESARSVPILSTTSAALTPSDATSSSRHSTLEPTSTAAVSTTTTTRDGTPVVLSSTESILASTTSRPGHNESTEIAPSTTTATGAVDASTTTRTDDAAAATSATTGAVTSSSAPTSASSPTSTSAATTTGTATTASRPPTSPFVRRGPTFSSGPYTAQVTNDQPVNSTVLQVRAQPQVPTDTVTYGLGSNIQGLFGIESDTGRVYIAVSPASLARRRSSSLFNSTVVFSVVAEAGGVNNSANVTVGLFAGCSPCPCVEGFACSPTCDPTVNFCAAPLGTTGARGADASSSNASAGLAAGAAVGGLALIILVVLLIIFLMRRRALGQRMGGKATQGQLAPQEPQQRSNSTVGSMFNNPLFKKPQAAPTGQPIYEVMQPQSGNATARAGVLQAASQDPSQGVHSNPLFVSPGQRHPGATSSHSAGVYSAFQPMGADYAQAANYPNPDYESIPHENNYDSVGEGFAGGAGRSNPYDKWSAASSQDASLSNPMYAHQQQLSTQMEPTYEFAGPSLHTEKPYDRAHPHGAPAASSTSTYDTAGPSAGLVFKSSPYDQAGPGAAADGLIFDSSVYHRAGPGAGVDDAEQSTDFYRTPQFYAASGVQIPYDTTATLPPQQQYQYEAATSRPAEPTALYVPTYDKARATHASAAPKRPPPAVPTYDTAQNSGPTRRPSVMLRQNPYELAMDHSSA